ncbi:MAG: hypothetical protein MUO60_11050 [Clostridiaceae bacterium]|nr:hypothetical protein [Clostridiaceae bacterium]
MLKLAKNNETHNSLLNVGCGNTVGVGVGIIAYAYKYTRDLDINEILQKGNYIHLDKNTWKQNITDVFTISATNIIEFKQDSINFNEKDREVTIHKILEHWPELKIICDAMVPEPKDIINTLKKAGAVCNPKELGLSKEIFRKSLIAAKDMRNRYGILQLLEDIGMLEGAASYITDIYYK